MKTEEKPSGQDCAESVGNLLKYCKVRELPACKRAGIATSTLHRWRRGSSPKTGQVDVLRRAILELAAEAKTLPDDLVGSLEKLRETVELPAGQKQDLESRVSRLELSVTELQGAVL